MKTYYIYGHWTKDTKEIFYIGIGTGNRMNSKSGRNIYWKNIVAKHGYIRELILDSFTDRDEAVKEEIRLQELNKPRACLQYGDTRLKIMSQETKNKIGDSNRGKIRTLDQIEEMSKRRIGKTATQETKDKMSRSRIGNKHTDESKQKMSRALIGKTRTDEVKLAKSISMLGHDFANKKQVVNCRGVVFNSMIEAGKSIMVNWKNISANCTGRQKTAGKYPDGTRIKWRYCNV